MPADKSADIFPIVSRTRANETFRDTLRLFVGRGRRYSVKQLSIGTGIEPRTIESFMAPIDNPEYRRPAIEHVFSLCKFLGADFAGELFSIADLGAFELPDGDDPDLARIAVEAVQDAAEISTIAAQGGNVHDLRDVANRSLRRSASLRAVALKTQPDLFDGRRVA